jgi:hypothetical protein
MEPIEPGSSNLLSENFLCPAAIPQSGIDFGRLCAITGHYLANQ